MITEVHETHRSIAPRGSKMNMESIDEKELSNEQDESECSEESGTNATSIMEKVITYG